MSDTSLPRYYPAIRSLVHYCKNNSPTTVQYMNRYGRWIDLNIEIVWSIESPSEQTKQKARDHG